MIQRGFLAIIAFVLGFSLHGQSVTPQVLASAGDVFISSPANLGISFTIGEIALVETFSAQSYHLTQGFQQPTYELVGLQDEDFVDLFEVYPNPASDFLHVRYQMHHAGRLQMRLYSMNGVEVIEPFDEKYVSGLETQSFNLAHLAQGMYFLQVNYRSPSKNIDHISHFKINVINP